MSVFWKEIFEKKLPPLKKFVWGDILEKRQNKEFTGFNGLNTESHVYNKFLPHGFTCENFDHERMHSGMGIETIEDGKNVLIVIRDIVPDEKNPFEASEVKNNIIKFSQK